MNLISVFILLIVYQIKHFVCDYPLQGKYMLQKFRADWGFFLPLLAHAGVHGFATFIIALFCGRHDLWWLGFLDMAIHFTMDRLKAGPKYLGQFKALSAQEFRGLAGMASYEGTNPELLGGKRLAEEKMRGNTYFWWSLGLDQMVHHLTHYIIIFLLIS